MTQAARRITATYAYHPANQEPDLTLPTEVVAHYLCGVPPGPLRGNFGPLEFSLKTDGVLEPLKISTDGVWAVLTDGRQRLRLAQKLGITELPVQVVPDNMIRMPMEYGRAVLESELSDWVTDHLWAHADHEVIRHQVGARLSSGGIPASVYLRCTCSCGSFWKEEA